MPKVCESSGWSRLEFDSSPPDPTEVLNYSGTYPSAFTVSRLSRQWSPQMHRITKVGGAEPAVPNLPWAPLEGFDPTSKTGRDEIVRRVRHVLPEAEAAFICGLEVFADQTWSDPHGVGDGKRYQDWPGIMAALPGAGTKGCFGLFRRFRPTAPATWRIWRSASTVIPRTAGSSTWPSVRAMI